MTIDVLIKNIETITFRLTCYNTSFGVDIMISLRLGSKYLELGTPVRRTEYAVLGKHLIKENIQINKKGNLMCHTLSSQTLLATGRLKKEEVIEPSSR